MLDYDSFINQYRKGVLNENQNINEVVSNRNMKRVSVRISEDENLDDLFHINVNMRLNESFVKRLAGGAAGLLLGKKVVQALAKAIGIKPYGVLYKVMTSRMVLTSIGAAFGKD